MLCFIDIDFWIEFILFIVSRTKLDSIPCVARIFVILKLIKFFCFFFVGGGGGEERTKFAQLFFHLPYYDRFGIKFHAINCSNYVIGLAIPEVNGVFPKKAFTRYFGLN